MAALLPVDVVIAAVNGPELGAVSGTEAAIRRLPGLAGFEKHSLSAVTGVPRVSFAADGACDRRLRSFSEPDYPASTPDRPASNVTGTWLTAAEATDPAYGRGICGSRCGFMTGCGSCCGCQIQCGLLGGWWSGPRRREGHTGPEDRGPGCRGAKNCRWVLNSGTGPIPGNLSAR